MQLISRDIPGSWYDNMSIVFEGDGPAPLQVEIARATSGSIMLAPHAPDETYSFAAELLALAECLIVKISQFTYIVEPAATTLRCYRSADRGRTWNVIDEAELAALTNGRTPERISEIS